MTGTGGAETIEGPSNKRELFGGKNHGSLLIEDIATEQNGGWS